MNGRLCAVGTLAALFALLTVNAVTGFALEADEDVLRTVHEPEFRDASDVVSTAGSGWGVAIFGLVVVALLLFLQRRREAVVFAISTAGGALNPLLKLIVDRPRPALWPEADRLSTSSFPSGHAASTAALALALIALMWHTRWRVHTIVVGSTGAAIVAMSRLQLGVHYPSDVVAAWIYATIWIIGVHAVARLLDRRRQLDDADVGPGPDAHRRAPVR